MIKTSDFLWPNELLMKAVKKRYVALTTASLLATRTINFNS